MQQHDKDQVGKRLIGEVDLLAKRLLVRQAFVTWDDRL